MKKTVIILVLTILIAITGCSSEANRTDDISNQSENSEPNASVAIHDLFEPKDATVYIEGLPVSVRYYPFGALVDSDIEGIASYVIFIWDGYHVEQQDNLLRVIWEGMPEIFMEIKQIPNTTVPEMERKVIASFDLDRHYFFRSPASDDFPFVRLDFYEGTDGIFERDSTVIRTYIKDNAHGGVFVATVQLVFEAVGGHGVRFENSLKTIEIIKGGVQ